MSTHAEHYELRVGLEVHVQLRTRTKLFCRCSTDTTAAPNTNTCPVCLGLPGALPALNEHAVRLAVRAALALGCTVNELSVFARKHYFYPDLPKGYQVTQYDQPLAGNGALEIGVLETGTPIVVGITRLHLEEDAGKLLHDRFLERTAVDFNRAGIPLIEIVSAPEMHAPEAAGAWLRGLRQLLQYADVSECSMEDGNLRVDANVSVAPRATGTPGERTEVKNLNSFAAVERAIAAEYARQCALVANGEDVKAETMLWDAAAGTVRPARRKEKSADYRYFADPDLPALALDAHWVDTIRRGMPEMPAARRTRMMREYGISEYALDVLISWPALADYYEGVARNHEDPVTAANWVMGEILAALRDRGGSLDQFPVRPADLAELLDLVRDGTLSNTAAKHVFEGMVNGGGPPRGITTRENLEKITDPALLRGWIEEALAERPGEVQRYRAGERQLQGLFVGAVMKKSGGAADPVLVNQMLEERLG